MILLLINYKQFRRSDKIYIYIYIYIYIRYKYVHNISGTFVTEFKSKCVLNHTGDLTGDNIAIDEAGDLAGEPRDVPRDKTGDIIAIDEARDLAGEPRDDSRELSIEGNKTGKITNSHSFSKLIASDLAGEPRDDSRELSVETNKTGKGTNSQSFSSLRSIALLAIVLRDI